ncbi:S-adenosyl-L-methionine-dependent methyltransferase [Sistotremastrum niveocremeum HHB9708]|uniref:S-adenosyl-L-methionine-dependent methyltransferase n=1 Tax=Sistotremastrum niveocremeum HHB9708 TaxID=1314777 RepID=A0A164W4B3_9AGAM|nr:S-adenosyl-L-methionine-dependent methyltransferase [Sistotremastrum niveocremeum HHB9708]
MDRLNLQHKVWTTMTNGLTSVPKEELDALLQRRPGGPSPSVLDVGCGSGIWCLEMAKAYPAAEITGIDLARCMPNNCPNDCTFVQSNLLDGLEKYRGKFSLVHSRTVLSHIKAEQRKWAIEELVRCLRPGGLIVLSDWDEIIVDEHGARLPAAQDKSDSKGSWLARVSNEAYGRDPIDSIIRFTIPDVLQQSAGIDQETLRMAFYLTPVGWDGGKTKNGALLGKMMRINFMDAFDAFKPVYLKRGFSEDLIQEWRRKLDYEFSGKGQRVFTRWHSTWARSRGIC